MKNRSILSHIALITLISVGLSTNSTASEAGSATKLRKNEPAPFSGVLLDEYDFRYLLTTEVSNELLKGELATAKIECNIELEKCAVKEVWYDSPWMWMLIGAVIGVSAK